MTQDHPDVVAYRRTAEAFRRRFRDLVKILIAPDVSWHVPGKHDMAARAVTAWTCRPGS